MIGTFFFFVYFIDRSFCLLLDIMGLLLMIRAPANGAFVLFLIIEAEFFLMTVVSDIKALFY